MRKKILKYILIPISILNLLPSGILAIYGAGLFDHYSESLLLIPLIFAILSIIISLHGLIKVKTQVYTFLSIFILSYIPLVYVGASYLDMIGWDSFLYSIFYPNISGYTIISWSPFVVIPLFLIGGIFLNYRRTGKFLKEVKTPISIV